MRGAVWRLEWRRALARPRLFAWNVAVPLLLLGPVLLNRATVPHRAPIFAVLFVLFGTFGACIPLVRDARTGWTRKVLLTGYSVRAWLTERCAAATALDLVQLAPVTILFLLAGPTAHWVAALAAVVLAVAAANVLGTAVAAAVRSLGEATLASAASALLAAHLAGTFRGSAPGTWSWVAQRWSPWRPLPEALRGAMGEIPSVSGVGGWGPPVLSGALLAVLMILSAPALAGRLSRVPEAD
ncbi:MAG: ABC transporter permease [Gemmatimonadota bacterium]